MRTYKIVSFSVVILLITVLFAGVATVAAAVPYTVQPTTMQFRYNAKHSGDYSPVAGPVPPNGELKWKYKTFDSVSSSPAVANGVVYVGSWDHYLYALNATTGTKLWNYKIGSSVATSPAVANGIVFVGGSWDDHSVDALDAATGTLKWKYTTGDYVSSSPTVANGIVFVGSDDHNVYALNATTGHKLWSYTTGDDVHSSPAVANGVVYVGSNDKNVYALNATTGHKLWSYTTGGGVRSSPAVVNGVVYVGSGDSNVYALDAATGAFKWKYTLGMLKVTSSPAVANGVVYIGSDDGNTGFFALDAATGALKWKYTMWHMESSPAVANGIVFVGSMDRNLYALDAATGAFEWKYATSRESGQVTSSPAVANGVVYVGSYDGYIYAIGSQSEHMTPTKLSITVSTTTPTINQPVTFTATLKSGTKLLASKPVTIYHYLNGIKYTDTTKTTNANGQITLTQSFGSAGQRTYYATFAGDTWYKASTSSVLNVNVKAPIRVTLAASTTTSAVNQKVTFTGKLYWWNPTANQWVPVTTGKSVTIYHYLNGVKYTDTTKTTANGQITLSQSFGSSGQRTYYATFAGDTWYKASTSAVVTISVH